MADLTADLTCSSLELEDLTLQLEGQRVGLQAEGGSLQVSS